MKKGINDSTENFIAEFLRESRLYNKQTAQDTYMALVKMVVRHLRDDGYLKLPGLGVFNVSRHMQNVVGLKQGFMGPKEVVRVSFKTSEYLGKNIKLNTN